MTDSDATPESGETVDAASVLSGGATVLVADDEELMREVVAIMIEENGGNVLTAENGLVAVEMFEKHKDQIDYVFLDFSMPGLDGYEAYTKMKEIKSDLCVLFVSGLSVTPEVQELVDNEEVLFLAKPFHEIELLEALASVKNLTMKT